jgi:N-acetylneuraminic acid mutarotase
MRTAPILAVLAWLAAGESASAPPALPEPVSNNAVAAVRGDDREYIVSLFGLGPGKTWRDLRADGDLHEVGTDRWRPLPPVPDRRGRLASMAVAVGGAVYVFGGYTVAEDGSESSTPEVFRLQVPDGRYERLADMPIPVDDTVALVYADRYVYLASGWHDVDNVALVQVYDTRENRWRRATGWPGTPVFGHAGAIAGHRMLVCDGVRVVSEPGRGRYAPSDECWQGTIDPENPLAIAWQRAPAHPGPARYRMAAFAQAGRFVFVGGSANPYNYDGVGYDGRPSEPSAGLLVFDAAGGAWSAADGPAVMDLRAVAVTSEGIHVIGGMRGGQRVASDVIEVAAPRP